jgi:hypothetical protein
VRRKGEKKKKEKFKQNKQNPKHNPKKQTQSFFKKISLPYIVQSPALLREKKIVIFSQQPLQNFQTD